MHNLKKLRVLFCRRRGGGRIVSSATMKVVGLVSGGKDSCYAMMRCIDYGHEIVALANLLPLEDSVDELDSYMYQTVGHQIVVSYAQCMGLPLFRRRIQGTARHQQLKYIQTQGDEVEDLLILLHEVKKQVPAVQGVSSGAIASDYQRLRVESVCSRLGFVSLAFLWKQEQALLLQEMIEKGIEAIVIKVAAIGLHPNKHLARDLVDLQPYLLQLNELYGINVCGEGGEYETLTLDCPLFKNARIVIDKFQVVLHSSDSIAPVGILHPLAFHLEPKSGNLVPGKSNEETFIAMSTTDWVHEVEGNDITSCCKADNELSKPTWDPDTHDLLNLIVSKTQSDIITLECWLQGSPKATQGLQNHLDLILKGIEDRLKEEHLGWEDVLYIHLYLADMNQFALANDTYVRYITEGNCPRGVPSRSTIEIPLAEGGHGNAMVEVLAAKDRSKRVLHVQSISCWAPSCIGPYSQATLHRHILYMAGQLGLDPPTMVLTSGGAAAQMQQAMINCEAVANTFNCSLLSSLISVTVYCPVSVTLDERNEIQDRLEKFLQQKLALGEDLSRDTKKVENSRPLILYVLVSMLPKRALVELKPLLYVPAPEDEDKIVDKVTCCMGTENDHWDCDDDLCISSSCGIFALCGHICASTVSVTQESIRKFCNERHHEVLHQSISWSLAEEKQFIMNIAKFCIHAQDKMLRKACIYWEDVVNFRVYFLVKVTSTDTLREAFIEAFGCMSAELHTLNRVGMLFDDKLSPQFFVSSFIPVLGIGRNTDMTNLITCELFASHF